MGTISPFDFDANTLCAILNHGKTDSTFERDKSVGACVSGCGERTFYAKVK